MPDGLLIRPIGLSRALLTRAALLYDAPDSPLRPAASSAVRQGFASGAAWMQLALETLRCQPMSPPNENFQRLGAIKYGLAGGAALTWLAICWLLAAPLLAPVVVVVFYLIEAQMVFLFPLALDGSAQAFREARRWTVRAGGSFAVMATVLPLAGCMLFGGFIGRGFIRSWCLGCLAVCLWYEDLRAAGPQP
jgi:hypothetical protein